MTDVGEETKYTTKKKKKNLEINDTSVNEHNINTPHKEFNRSLYTTLESVETRLQSNTYFSM